MDLKTIFETENHDVNVTLCGKPYTISAERNIYNAIRIKYDALADKALEQFKTKFEGLNNIEELVEKVPGLFIEACEEPLLEIVSDIISIDIYTVDKDTIIEKAFEGDYFDPFLKEYSKYESQYNSIISELEGAEYAREQRKQNRSRWQSTTIGGDAITAWSNQLETASMNAAEGLAHSVFNAIGNSMDRAEAKKKLKALFNNKNRKIELYISVNISCMNLYKLLINIVKKNSDMAINHMYPSDNDCSKAEAMFNNLAAIKLNKDKQEEFIRNILILNPYNSGYYKKIINDFGDEDKAFQTYGELHGIDMLRVKNVILCELVEENLGTTEDDAHKCQEMMEKRAEEINIDKQDITSGQILIDEQLKKLDEEYRTVENIMFATREEADCAREELVEIKKIMDTVKAPNSESTLSYETELLKTKKEIEGFQTDIKNSYIKKLDSLLQDFEKSFCNVGWKTLTRKEAGIERALIFAKKLPVGNYEELDESIQKLKDYLPELGVDYEEATSTSDYFNSCERKLNTVDGVPCSDREEAAKARKELEIVRAIMNDVQPPTKESLLDYEQKLLNVRSEFEKLETPLKTKYVNLINGYLSSFDEKFRRISLIKLCATREEAAKERALKFVKSKTYNTLTDVANVREELNNLLPNLGITLEQADSATNHLQSMENKINGVGGGSIFSGLFGRKKK